MMDYDKKLAAHPRWQYQPGMVTMTGHIVIEDDDGPFVWLTYGGQMSCLHKIDSDECVPDIEHPATQGWMMSMLMEARADRIEFSDYSDGDDWWSCTVYGPHCTRIAETQGPRGQALAAALLRVWGELGVWKPARTNHGARITTGMGGE